MSVSIGSGHEGNVRQQVDAYIARVKGGEMGALPSVLSLFVLTILFAALNPYFFSVIFYYVLKWRFSLHK